MADYVPPIPCDALGDYDSNTTSGSGINGINNTHEQEGTGCYYVEVGASVGSAYSTKTLATNIASGAYWHMKFHFWFAGDSEFTSPAAIANSDNIQVAQLICSASGKNLRLQILPTNDAGGKRKWNLGTNISGSPVGEDFSPGWAKGAWREVDMYGYVDNSAGWMQLWEDTTKHVEITGIDTYSTSAFNWLRTGVIYRADTTDEIGLAFDYILCNDDTSPSPPGYESHGNLRARGLHGLTLSAGTPAGRGIFGFTAGMGTQQGRGLYIVPTTSQGTQRARGKFVLGVDAYVLQGRGQYGFLELRPQQTRLLYRLEETTTEYALYRGVDAEIDFDAAPWETFSGLPHTSAALAASHTYNFAVRRRNNFGLFSHNISAWTITLDGAGDLVATPPSAPDDAALEPAAGGTTLVTAHYLYPADGDNAADEWLVYLTSDGSDPDPAVDVPTEVSMAKMDGVAKLSWTSAAFGDGATVKVILRTRRSGTPDVDSTNSNILTTTADTDGPAVPGGAEAFFGTEGAQH